MVGRDGRRLGLKTQGLCGHGAQRAAPLQVGRVGREREAIGLVNRFGDYVNFVGLGWAEIGLNPHPLKPEGAAPGTRIWVTTVGSRQDASAGRSKPAPTKPAQGG